VGPVIISSMKRKEDSIMHRERNHPVRIAMD
jgi:hypothetical protein